MRWPVILVFSGLSLLSLGTTVVWLHLDHTAPTWDDAIYLTNSLQLFDALSDGGIIRYAREFFTLMDTKPPLLVTLPTAIYLIVGRHPKAAYAINLLFLLLLFIAVFRLARRFVTGRAGLLAIYLIATTPMLYGLSRWFLVECSLTAVVAMAICMLRESEHLKCTSKVVAFSCLSGLGLLLKFTFPLYVFVPFLHEAIAARWTAVRVKTLLALMLPVIVLALPWYALHFRSALQTALDTGSEETMAQFFFGTNVHSVPVIGAYLFRLLNAGPPLYFGALLVLLILACKRLSPAARAGLRLCALWATPIVFLIIWPSREVRYAAPLYPALALALAILIEQAVGGSKWRLQLAGVLLALPLASMFQVSFGFLGKWHLERGGVLFDPQRLAYAKTYDQQPWPYHRILEDLHRAERLGNRTEDRLLIATDSGHFNADTIMLAATERKLPFHVTTTAYEKDWNNVLRLLDWAAFVMYEEGGGPTATYFNRYAKAVVKELAESGKFVELSPVRSLPDGGVARVFQNASQNGFVLTGSFLPSVRGIPKPTVTFADMLELNGLAVVQKESSLEVKYRWRSLRPVDREYWCFTHVVDTQGKVVAYLDHLILNGHPPMAAWKDWDVAAETIRFRSATIQNGHTYQLRVGLYDLVSGGRLPISKSILPLTDGQTAAIMSAQASPKVMR